MSDNSAPNASLRGGVPPPPASPASLLARVQDLEFQNEQLREDLAQCATYLASMSHEMKAPLNAINGFTELLSDPSFGEMTAEQRGFVARVRDAGEHLLQLVSDIIDIARVDADRLAIDPQPVAINHCVEQAVLVSRGIARDKQIRIQIDPDPAHPVVLADDRRTKQVLFNLISNAIKYSDEGSVVRVRVESERRRVRIWVEDEGMGIAPEEQERVFEAFHRAEGADQRAEGAGLGLALTRKLVELHGGEIGLESVPGAGSRFWFTLPIAAPPG